METIPEAVLFTIGFFAGALVCLLFWSQGSHSRSGRIRRQSRDLGSSQKRQANLEQYEHLLNNADNLLRQLHGIKGITTLLAADEKTAQHQLEDLKIVGQSVDNIHHLLKETMCLHDNQPGNGEHTEAKGALTTPVLVVDDQEITLKTTKMMLEGLGFSVDTAKDGQEAVEKFGAKKYDLILMDYVMPGMDGTTACLEIRKISGVKPVKVIAVTAKARRGDKEKMLACGMDDYVSKPFNRDDLKKAISKFYSFPDNSKKPAA